MVVRVIGGEGSEEDGWLGVRVIGGEGDSWRMNGVYVYVCVCTCEKVACVAP